MSGDEWVIVSEMTLATFLNTVATLEDGHDPLPLIVASGAFALSLLFLSDIFDPDVARAFGAVFLGSTVILRYKVWGPILNYVGGTK